MKLSDIRDISREMAETMTTEKLGPRPEPKADAEDYSTLKTKMPYGAIWLSVLLTTLCCLSFLFAVATISVVNILGAVICLGAGVLFGWLAFKSIGWTDTL